MLGASQCGQPNRIEARKAVILLDTCESGALVSGYARSRSDAPASEAALGRLHEATGRPVLTAAAEGNPAFEGYEGHGVFTWALLRSRTATAMATAHRAERAGRARHHDQHDLERIEKEAEDEAQGKNRQHRAVEPARDLRHQFGDGHVAARLRNTSVNVRAPIRRANTIATHHPANRRLQLPSKRCAAHGVHQSTRNTLPIIPINSANASTMGPYFAIA